jgi:hypothetical protein
MECISALAAGGFLAANSLPGVILDVPGYSAATRETGGRPHPSSPAGGLAQVSALIRRCFQVYNMPYIVMV